MPYFNIFRTQVNPAGKKDPPPKPPGFPTRRAPEPPQLSKEEIAESRIAALEAHVTALEEKVDKQDKKLAEQSEKLYDVDKAHFELDQKIQRFFARYEAEDKAHAATCEALHKATHPREREALMRNGLPSEYSQIDGTGLNLIQLAPDEAEE